MGLTLISSHTASSDATLDITSGIDSTYNEYQFQLVNMHPATDKVDFLVQFNAASGSNTTGFDQKIVSTAFYVQHGEGDGAGSSIDYQVNFDQGQGTGYQALNYEVGNNTDQSVSGILTLYDPSSTTYVKHFMTRTANAQGDDYFVDWYTAGYINTTSAIDEISFMFDSGNIDAGTIYMYGVS